MCTQQQEVKQWNKINQDSKMGKWNKYASNAVVAYNTFK